MPSQATPLPIAPAAQSAKPARNDNPSRAAEGFEDLVNEAKRDGNRAGEVAETVPAIVGNETTADAQVLDNQTDSFVAATPVRADARPAAGLVQGAGDAGTDETLSTQGGSQEPTVSDPKTRILDLHQAKTDPVPAKPGSATVSGATPEPASAEITPDLAAESDAEAIAVTGGATEPDTGTPSATAREARIAETLQRIADPQPGVRTQSQAQAQAQAQAASVEVKPEASDPKGADLSAKAETVTSDGEPVEADILAPLREGRPASERSPGELIRGEARAGRTGPEASPAKPDAKSGTGEAKAAAGASAPSAGTPDVRPATLAPAQASVPQQPAPAVQAPPLELLLAQTPLADTPVAEAPIDPALSKSDTIFDLAAARTEARAEIRTASTLQFAQGPRLTPQSAQTLAAQIAQRFSDGGRVFDIRLDPPELGRVEVRLEVGKDNSVRAVLAAERTETLAELQRSARDLERALTEAGLDVGEDALSFSLTDDSDLSEDAGGETGPDTPVFMNSEADADALAAPIGPISTYGFLLARADGLDVSV